MYFLIELTSTAESIPKAIWEKSSLDEAIMSLHQTLASSMANPAVQSCMCMIIDIRGSVIRYDYWERENNEED